jgi:predicted MFS family arabinose efflux permease
VLFAAAVWLPFGVDAASFVVAAVLAASLRGSFRPVAQAAPTGWRSEIRVGYRWLWSNALLRNLAVALALTNLAFAACESTFVLFATEELGVSDRAFGGLIAIVGAGSVLAGLAGGWLVAKVGRRFAILVASFTPVVTMVAIGTVPVTWWVVLMTTVQAVMITIWSIIAVTLRQQIVPDRLFGRVNSVFRWCTWGAMPVGALLGGVIAQRFGLRAPYFAGAAIMFVAYLLIVGNLRERNIQEAIAANPHVSVHDSAVHDSAVHDSGDETPLGMERDPLDDLLDGML